MTDSMRDIQQATLECVEASISELRRAGTGLELDDWTPDSALHWSFDVIVRRQLDPVWHRLSYKTRQIVSDLAVLRSILQYVLARGQGLFLLMPLGTVPSSHAMRSPLTNIWIRCWPLTSRLLGQQGKISRRGSSSTQQIPSSKRQDVEYIPERLMPSTSPDLTGGCRTLCGLCSKSNPSGWC